MPNVTYQPGRVVIARPVESADLKPEDALTLRQARDRFDFRGKGNRPLNLETLRRWANPKRGHRPAGDRGPTLIFPSVILYGEHLTKAEWVEWFLAESARIRDAAREVVVPETDAQRDRRNERNKRELRREGMQV
jgi:hypothetical protein